MVLHVELQQGWALWKFPSVWRAIDGAPFFPTPFWSSGVGRELQGSTVKWRVTSYYCWSCHAVTNGQLKKKRFFWLCYSQTGAKYYCVKILRKKTPLCKIYVINNLPIEKYLLCTIITRSFFWFRSKTYLLLMPYLNKFSVGHFYLTGLAMHDFMVALYHNDEKWALKCSKKVEQISWEFSGGAERDSCPAMYYTWAMTMAKGRKKSFRNTPTKKNLQE